MNLSKNVKVVLAKAGQSAGTSAVTTDVIDTQGYEGVIFLGSIGTANANNYVKIQQGTASNMSDAADLEGSKVTPANNGDSFLVDIYKPRERYLWAVINRGASTTTGDVYAILYGARKEPVSHGATINAELHVSPAEGTA
jgi:hypothetical protein